jgi:type I restriction enzyme M protein
VNKIKRHKQDNYQLSLIAVDYKDAYQQIRNYLAGKLMGATRDETLLQEVIKCLFCKLYIKRDNSEIICGGDADAIAFAYKQTFETIRTLLPSLFADSSELILDSESLAYIDQKLEFIDLNNWSRDPFGDIYEVFIGSIVRGQEGQFFTPQNAIELLVSIVDPRPGERIIDPACGAGGFLNAAARHLVASGASTGDIAHSIFGVDKDRDLVNLAAARLSLVLLDSANVFCADSLVWASDEREKFPLSNQMGEFDVVLTNPPFGSRIVSTSRVDQASFDLGYKWHCKKGAESFIKLQTLQSSVPPQVLFIERCLELVRPGGRIGMVVPESVISGRNYRYVVNFIRHYADIKAVIGMPESLFKISGKGGTHTKTCILFIQKKGDVKMHSKTEIFMAEAKWCGNDSRGRQIVPDDLPLISENYHKYCKNELKKYSHLGYPVSADAIVDNILAPRYYDPDATAELLLLKETHELVKIGDLASSNLIKITTGDEIGKLAYGTGTIPFVRTSDISNWEVKIDPKHGVSEEIYKSLALKQDVREGDILMVRDGTYLIGTCAFITKYDTRILFQSHLYKLRVTDPDMLSPYLLLAALSSAPVQRQIKAKRFTQDIIDSLGDRIYEIILPIPKDNLLRERIEEMVKKAIEERIEARELARRACLEIVGQVSLKTI